MMAYYAHSLYYLNDSHAFQGLQSSLKMGYLKVQHNLMEGFLLPNETRYSQFLALDKLALKSLPKQRYEFVTWKKEKAGIDYHIAVDKHYKPKKL